MYGRTPEAAEARQALTLETMQQYVGGCREWLPEKADNCWAPAEYVLWGKLISPVGLGPRCYDHAAVHVGHQALAAGANYALVNIGELARKIDEAHQAPVASRDKEQK